MTPTIGCTYEQFRQMAGEFFRALPTANAEELDAGLKCLGLAYLGIQWGDSRLDEIHQEVGAPTILRLATGKAILRELELGAL